MEMTKAAALAIHKAIRRNSPFFKPNGDPFGRDWQTFRTLYPQTAALLALTIRVSGQEPR